MNRIDILTACFYSYIDVSSFLINVHNRTILNNRNRNYKSLFFNAIYLMCQIQKNSYYKTNDFYRPLIKQLFNQLVYFLRLYPPDCMHQVLFQEDFPIFL